MMTIHYRLDELLTLRGISARKLSRDTGISTATLSAIKQNKAELLSRSTLNRLCAALRCTPGDLIVYIPDAVLPPASISYPPTQPANHTIHEG